MSVILVSACLVGCSCRYKGDGCENALVIDLARDHVLVPVCPEQLGGLPTPRNPSERIGDRVVMNNGRDVTEAYHKGAAEALRIAKLVGAETAVLKAKSPSCGNRMIYDGSFSGNLIPGAGVTAALFKENGIRVLSEVDLEQGLFP
ncbi:MAG: DUF523 domain-containing protein [Oscillospiraceae bacterium]|nr:DUF523 domain-containing protein [Oscillospiraceae bacterium]